MPRAAGTGPSTRAQTETDRCEAMDDPDSPLVSVVTPVYNGARYLAACVESVGAQSYPRFEHVIVDNASTDETRRIANGYAERDPRIRVVECMEKLPIIANWNRAIRFISDESRFVWVLPADDALMVDSLTRMVDVARRNPTVGIVASLRLRGHDVQCAGIQCAGLPEDQELFSGREIVRMFLREEVFAFSPTGSLIRRDLIDAKEAFYPSRYLHADIAAFFDVLDGVDFGFVHEILMFSREHERTITSSVVNHMGTQFRDGLLMLQEFGPRYFAPDELAAIETKLLLRYYRFLVRSAVLLRERQLFRFHGKALREAGRSPSFGALARAAVTELERTALEPLLALKYVRTRIRQPANRDKLWELDALS